MKEKLKDIFESRGFEMRDYSARNILEYVTPKKPHVSAMGTSGGKTLMEAARRELYYSTGILKKNDITLILPSDKTILRGNFVKQFQFFFKDIPASFTWIAVKNRKELKEAVDNKIQVIIVLPQLLNDKNIELLKGCKIKWMVLDEAHKWYFAKTIQRIIDTLKPKYQSLLTGTPFKFNEKKDKFIIDYTSVSEMYGKGLLSNVDMQVLHSSLELTKLDYQSLLGSLKEDTRIDSRKYRELFRDVLSQLIKKLKLPNKSMSTLNNASKNAISVFGKLEKSIIFAHGIPEAKCLDKYLKELGVGVLTSHSKNLDEIPEETFTEFENNPKIKVLIAVNRGKEGFDFPDLYNVIDMTFTQNFEVVMQIVGRLMRKSKNNNNKVFYKIAPKNTAGYFVDWMDCMFMLFDDYWYQNFNGKNAYDIRIPNALLARNKNLNQQTTTSKTKKGNFKPKNLEELLPNSLSFMNKNAWFKLDDPLSTVATTSLKSIISKFFGWGNGKHWDINDLIEAAKIYNRRVDFARNNKAAYYAALRMGVLDNITTHMDSVVRWNYQAAKKKSLEYKSVKDYTSDSKNSGYHFAKSNGYYDEFTSHMEKRWSPKWTLDSVSAEALKYKTKKEFQKGSIGAYAWALRNNKIDKITSHMVSSKINWTKKLIFDIIKKYKTLNEFRKNDRLAYYKAREFGIDTKKIGLSVGVKLKCNYCGLADIDSGNYKKSHGEQCKHKNKL
jgi:superfamily II DNA or RNA helicase